jgi:hypothetical protein
MITFFKDLFWVLTVGLWRLWKTQRMISKMEYKVKKMENDIGSNATFIHFFEASMDYNSPEMCKEVIQSYLDSATREDKAEENWQTIISYAKKYDCYL